MTDLRSEPQRQDSGSPLRLLILDDDPLVGEMVRMMAASTGAESAYCLTASEFLVSTFDGVLQLRTMPVSPQHCAERSLVPIPNSRAGSHPNLVGCL